MNINWRKLDLGLLLVMSVMYGTVSAEPMYVSDQLVLNVYSSADPSSERLATLETGDQVEMLEESEGFYRVRLEDGTEGWVGLNYLSTEPPAMIRLRRLESEQKTALQQAEKKHAANLKTLQDETTALRTERDALKAQLDTPPLPAPQPAPSPQAQLPSEPDEHRSTRNVGSIFFWLSFVILAGGAGFFAGYQTLARRIRNKFGGVKIY
jgi:Bacterial SH3 domain